MSLSDAKLGMQHHDTRWGGVTYTKNVLLLVSVELIPFPEKPESPIGKLLELATGDGPKALVVRCSFTTDVIDSSVRASTIQFVSTNLTNVSDKSASAQHR
jgi:hypothetical protein